MQLPGIEIQSKATNTPFTERELETTVETTFDPYLRIAQLSLKKIIFGVNAQTRVGFEVRQLLQKEDIKTLLVTDPGIVKSGLSEKVAGVLKDSRINVQTFGEVEPEPTLRCVRQVTEIVRKQKFDAIVGLGGGSAMDVAKTASIMATNPGDAAEYFQFMEDKVKNKPLTKVLISTTSGTGSEISFGVVATDDNGFKNFINSPLVQADVSIVDPLMTVSCPPRITAGCGMDAYAHLIETYVNFAATPLSDAFALHGIKLATDNVRTAVYHGEDLTARHNMAIASTLGGLCTSIVTNNIGHCISEGIGPMYKLHHGAANAIVLPYQLLFNIPAAMERVASLAPYLGIDSRGLTSREAAVKVAHAVRDLVADIGLPTSLKEANIPREDIPKIADRVMKLHDNYDLTHLNPMKVNMKNVTELATDMWEGNLRLA